MPPMPARTMDTGALAIAAQFPVLIHHRHVIVVPGADGDAVARAEDEPSARLGAGHGPAHVGPDVAGGPADEVLDGDASPQRDPVAVLRLERADVHSGGRLNGLVSVVPDLDEHLNQGIDIAAAVLEDLL